MATYELVVLGTGTAGMKVALRCRAAGWRVAIVDNRPFGGTCALRGCEPKKALWSVAEAVDRSRRLGRACGIEAANDLGMNWPAAIAFKRTFTDPVPPKRAQRFEAHGIEALSGTGRFVGPRAIRIGDRTLEARHVLIATGAMPAPLRIEGADQLLTSDDFLELERLPNRIILVGGGYISFEFAHIATRAGAHVTILHSDDRPLAKFDHDLVSRLVEHSRRVGIAVELNAEVNRITRDRGDSLVTVETRDGRRFEAAIAVHGLGRVPDVEQLALAAGGVETEHGHIRLDEFLRSVSNPAVFAAGDAAGKGPALTPVASHDAECVARNLLEGCTHKPDYTGFGSAVFAIPPLAMVGLTEEQARRQGRDVDVHAGDMSNFESVRREAHENSGSAYKVILERQTRAVLGAHMFGPGAPDVINQFAQIIRSRLSARELERLLSAYPSAASDVALMIK